MGVVYYVICKINGKGYVGVDTKSDDGSRRWRGHARASRKGSKLLLTRAIRKHSADNFVFHPVWESDDKEALFAKEEHFIRWFGTKAPRGYNMVDGGFGGCRNPCAETSARLSAKSRAAWQRPEVRTKLKTSLKAAFKRPEVQAKLRAAWAQPEVKAKISGDKSHMKRPEQRARVSTWAKRQWEDSEYRARRTGENNHTKGIKFRTLISASCTRQMADPVHKAKILAALLKANRGKKHNPERCDRASKRMKQAYVRDPELRDKIAEATRAAWADPVKRAKRLEGIRRAACSSEPSPRALRRRAKRERRQAAMHAALPE